MDKRNKIDNKCKCMPKKETYVYKQTEQNWLNEFGRPIYLAFLHYTHQ